MELTEYKTIQRWQRQLRKNATKFDPNAEIPYDTWRQCKAAITKFCKFTKMTPDEIIEDARNENRTVGDLLKHMDFLDKFWEQYPTKTTAGIYVSLLKGLYSANGTALEYKSAGIPKIKPKDMLLTSTQVRKICDCANLKHKSWILGNNYMGLRIGAFPLLTVANFLTDNWKEDDCLYPVFIPRAISGTFDYHTFIGNDAMQVLRTYFESEGFSLTDKPWNYNTNGMNNILKRCALDAEVITAPHGTHAGKVPRGNCKVHSHLFRKRIETTLERQKIDPNWIDALLGHIRHSM